MARPRQSPNSCSEQGVGQHTQVMGLGQVAQSDHSNCPDSPHPWDGFLEKHVHRKWVGCQTYLLFIYGLYQ